MSTTRSHSLPAPATEAAARPRLVLVAHGSRRTPLGDLALLRHARTLAASGCFESVDFGVLFGEPSVRHVVERLPAGPVTVVPLFMCDGAYTRSTIPQLFDGRAEVRFCCPIGLHSALPQIIAERAANRADQAGMRADQATLLLIGHGSTKSQASRDATRTVARRLRRAHRFRSVRTAYLEQAPMAGDVLARLSGPVIAAGLFAGEGVHACEDVPALLDAYDAGPLLDLGAVGAFAEIPEIILEQVAGTQ